MTIELWINGVLFESTRNINLAFALFSDWTGRDIGRVKLKFLPDVDMQAA